jgi:hypothetical protein
MSHKTSPIDLITLVGPLPILKKLPNHQHIGDDQLVCHSDLASQNKQIEK